MRARNYESVKRLFIHRYLMESASALIEGYRREHPEYLNSTYEHQNISYYVSILRTRGMHPVCGTALNLCTLIPRGTTEWKAKT